MSLKKIIETKEELQKMAVRINDFAAKQAEAQLFEWFESHVDKFEWYLVENEWYVLWAKYTTADVDFKYTFGLPAEKFGCDELEFLAHDIGFRFHDVSKLSTFIKKFDLQNKKPDFVKELLESVKDSLLDLKKYHDERIREMQKTSDELEVCVADIKNLIGIPSAEVKVEKYDVGDVGDVGDVCAEKVDWEAVRRGAKPPQKLNFNKINLYRGSWGPRSENLKVEYVLAGGGPYKSTYEPIFNRRNACGLKSLEFARKTRKEQDYMALYRFHETEINQYESISTGELIDIVRLPYAWDIVFENQGRKEVPLMNLTDWHKVLRGDELCPWNIKIPNASLEGNNVFYIKEVEGKIQECFATCLQGVLEARQQNPEEYRCIYRLKNDMGEFYLY